MIKKMKTGVACVTLFASDYRRMAREILRGNWALAVGVGFVAGLLGADISGGLPGGSSGRAASENGVHNSLDQLFPIEFLHFLRPFLFGIGTILLVWVIINIVIGGAITLGYAKFNLELADRRSPNFETLFSQLYRLGAGFCMQLLRGLYTFLWALLFIIPGIVANISYAMTPYIMADHPEYGANEAIGISKRLMYGHKWRYFCLQLSFIGWAFLCVLTFGIGFLWLNPYREAANAAFYRSIGGR